MVPLPRFFGTASSEASGFINYPLPLGIHFLLVHKVLYLVILKLE